MEAGLRLEGKGRSKEIWGQRGKDKDAGTVVTERKAGGQSKVTQRERQGGEAETGR